MLRELLKELARVRSRFGYWRLNVLPRTEGHEVNNKRLSRVYREEQLHAVAVDASWPSARGPRGALPPTPNQRWSLDFVRDQLTDGRRFRVLTIVDD